MAANNIGKSLSDEHRAKISAAMKGKKNSLGCVRSDEFRKKLSVFWNENVESLNTYIDGKSHARRRSRYAEISQLDYRMWREAVFKRDGWKCVLCGSAGALHADHIKPYATFPELRLTVENGRTLCPDCHHKTDTWGAKARKHTPKMESA